MLRLLAVLIQQPPDDSPGLSVDPSTEGMPGADLIEQMLGWAQMVALWGSLAALLAGAAMYGLARETGSYGAAHRGKSMAMGGAIGAVLAGLAPSAVEMLFTAAR